MKKQRFDSILNTTITYDDNEFTSDLKPINWKNIPNEKIFYMSENPSPIPYGDIQQLEISKQLEKYKSYYIPLCYGIQELEKNISTNKIYIADKIKSQKVSQNEIDRLKNSNKKNKSILKENIRNKKLLEKYIESIESKKVADSNEVPILENGKVLLPNDTLKIFVYSYIDIHNKYIGKHSSLKAKLTKLILNVNSDTIYRYSKSYNDEIDKYEKQEKDVFKEFIRKHKL